MTPTIPFLPNPIAKKGVLIYLATVVIVSVLFLHYAMPPLFILMGVVWVSLFFGLTVLFSKQWMLRTPTRFAWSLVGVALAIRIVWVFVSYFFYRHFTGGPFEFNAADSLGYHSGGIRLSQMSWADTWNELFEQQTTVSDSGYLFYLSSIYRIIGPTIIGARLLKCLWSALTCWLLYRLARRTISETTARLVGIMACMMPNLIIYCGMHLKETEMILLIMLFIERSDHMLRNQRFRLLSVVLPLLSGLALFTFRTVMGATAFASLGVTLLLAGKEAAKWKQRVTLGAAVAIGISLFIGGTIAHEVESTWEERFENQIIKRDKQQSEGIRWAKYATGTVIMPMIFVMPFSTMVDVDDQRNQNMLHAGNYVRNFLGIFVLIALFNTFFRNKDWRNKLLPISFAAGYLAIVSLSGFANSERFVLPALPILLLLAADGITQLNVKNYRWVKLWYWIVPIMEVAWAYFKIGSRGLL